MAAFVEKKGCLRLESVGPGQVWSPRFAHFQTASHCRDWVAWWRKRGRVGCEASDCSPFGWAPPGRSSAVGDSFCTIEELRTRGLV